MQTQDNEEAIKLHCHHERRFISVNLGEHELYKLHRLVVTPNHNMANLEDLSDDGYFAKYPHITEDKSKPVAMLPR